MADIELYNHRITPFVSSINVTKVFTLCIEVRITKYNFFNYVIGWWISDTLKVTLDKFCASLHPFQYNITSYYQGDSNVNMPDAASVTSVKISQQLDSETIGLHFHIFLEHGGYNPAWHREYRNFMCW